MAEKSTGKSTTTTTTTKAAAAANEERDQKAAEAEAEAKADLEAEDGLDTYEVVMDHTHDGEKRKIGETVRLTSEAGSKMTVEGLVVQRADKGREKAHRALVDDPSTRGTSN